MSETPESPTRPTAAATEAAAVAVKPYWLYRFAAWVVIVAGIVFIVLSVFFTGFKVAHLGHHKCHHHGWHHQQPGGPTGPRHHDQGAAFHHGSIGPGGPGPSHMPESVAPSLAPAHS
jgi:hypothetical protein